MMQDPRMCLVMSMLLAWMAWQYAAWRLNMRIGPLLPALLVGAFALRAAR